MMYAFPGRTDPHLFTVACERPPVAERDTRPKTTRAGFTLLELLVVLAILTMIAAFAAPEVLRHMSGARSDAAKVEIGRLSNAVDIYRLDVGRCPPDLSALLAQPSGATGWNGPYLRRSEIPRDPWGNEYVYRCPGEDRAYDLYSLGPDGDGRITD
jgi:general secretion pathway protein G